VLLIDGYNVLHALPGGASRDRLIELLVAHCRSGNHAALIVFDATGGMRRRAQLGPVEVRVVAEGRKADSEILDLIDGTADRTAYTLVSNDLELVRAAEKKGMRVLRSEDFAKSLLEAPESPEKRTDVPPGEVDFWLKEFGLDDDPKC
jgi:predicted RNA-binding protein with PIN domain